jgi:hypothetical protein
MCGRGFDWIPRRVKFSRRWQEYLAMWRASPMKPQGLPEIGDEWFGVDTGQHAGHEALLLNVLE